jgi:dihydroneopterin aldolase
MGTITLKSIQFHARHGVLPHEKVEGNDFEVDVIADADLLRAARTDDLAHTLDYGRAADIVGDVMHGESVDLIETLVHRIGDRLMSAFPAVRDLTVAVRKLNPPIDGQAAYSEVRETWRM